MLKNLEFLPNFLQIHHPDRGGDAQFFDKIAKAHQALTDKEARENWEKYGNPDGPTATTFGIALPKWLVSKEYGLWVLAFYGLIFMIILPVSVVSLALEMAEIGNFREKSIFQGMWWYSSIKYSADKVLLDTTRMYYYFINRTPRMEIGSEENRFFHKFSARKLLFWRFFTQKVGFLAIFHPEN